MADIPQNLRKFKTKPEIAFEIVEHHKEIGVDFDFVGGDGLADTNDFEFIICELVERFYHPLFPSGTLILIPIVR
jgi:MoaA/NifB/PqqE/SkfB family radical SAM enzyme